MKKKKKKTVNNYKNNYQIIITQNKKQTEYIGCYKNLSQVLKKYNDLLEENKNIIFPVKYINTKFIHEVEYELVILKIKDNNDNTDEQLKLLNEVGKYIETTITSKYTDNSKYGKKNKNEYVIYDKSKWNKEENFWVYGYHPKYQRKTFNFIFETYIMPMKYNKNGFNRLTCFKNKLLIEHDTDFNIIICKNYSDCIRLYNIISNYADTNRIYHIIWNGIYKKVFLPFWIDKIQNITNWNYKKIMRNSTRP